LENYFHHVSKFIVNECQKNGIGTIIIGKNDGWKNGINLGKKNNQAFCAVPTYLLLEKIKYKALAVGIEVVFTEESYTSKASFYDNDALPQYGDDAPEFSGKRKHRGLYVTKDGFAVNADVNGSLNIGRKVIPEFLGIGDRSLAARPVVVNPLKVA
jgi:IS605 OrfB family transposase